MHSRKSDHNEQGKLLLNILRLWNRLVQMSDDRLTKQIFINDFYLAMSDYQNWCKDIWQILCTLEMEDTFYNRETCDLNYVREQLYKLQEINWKKAILHKPKLRFYRTFKKSQQLENYVKFNLTGAQRSFMAQLRFGILPIQVETGRFRNVKLEERICTLCQLNEVEEEYHFLFQCPTYVNLRQI